MRVGVLGGGQLGRMLALAGYPLGLRFRFLDPSPDAPAGHVGTLVAGSFSDPDTLRRFRSDVDVVTYELEHVPYSVVEALNRETPVLPGPRAIHVAQDRLLEKQFFQSVGIPTGWFAPVAAPQALAAAAEEAGYPCLLKTRRQGYDGKGQRWLRSSADLSAAWE
ncbi:MAG: ATP-grasp domain-containing protein, partial [SAR202 cluster bacterium]|nr:ATP-grasp domain-containing protein [SAR202 cluster bacterium]